MEKNRNQTLMEEERLALEDDKLYKLYLLRNNKKQILLFGCLLFRFWTSTRAVIDFMRHKQNGVAEGCWSHDKEVGVSKPLSATKR